jgi:radical SAM enzyme (TIGR01210 family)
MEKISELIADLNDRRISSLKQILKKSHKESHEKSYERYSNKNQKKYDKASYISAWLEDEIGLDNSKPVKSLVVILRTKGCGWARNNIQNQFDKKDTKKFGDSSISSIGGCTMCGYINDCVPEELQLNSAHLVQQFKKALDKFEDKDFSMVKIFTSGSFLDDKEVFSDARSEILDMLNKAGISDLIIETRPEFVTAQSLSELSDSFKGKLQLAMGLESSNDNVLKYIINKGFSFDEYKRAVSLAREFNFYVKTYLLLKPPFFSERDAIIDVLDSIENIKTGGLSDCISINPVNIQKFTVVEYLYNRRDYRPPWLWSVLEILRRGYSLLGDSGIRLISDPTAAGTQRGAHNCYTCDKKVLEMIKQFTLNSNPDPEIFNQVKCSCREKWKDILVLENSICSNINIY